MASGLSSISGSQINDAENTIGAGNALIDGVIDIGEPFNRLIKHQHCGKKEKKVPGVELPLITLYPP